jgi:hypothetical protein
MAGESGRSAGHDRPLNAKFLISNQSIETDVCTKSVIRNMQSVTASVQVHI